jgi:hypothetical protein
MSENPSIHHYGLYKADGLVYLHQSADGSGECWEFDIPSPFQAKVPGVKPPHWFSPTPRRDWKGMKHRRLLKTNRLLQALVPQYLEKNARVVLLPSSDSFADVTAVLQMLEFCCSAHGGGFRVFNHDSQDYKSIVSKLQVTNLTPLVVSNLRLKDYPVVEQVLAHSFTSTRNVVFIVPSDFPPVAGAEYITSEEFEEAKKFINTNVPHNFRDYGASYLKEMVLAPLFDVQEDPDNDTAETTS